MSSIANSQSHPGEDTRGSIAEMRGFLKLKQQLRRARNQALWHQAAQDASKIVEMIGNDFHPQGIYQWGSVLHPDDFDERSDIDIAVEGIGGAERFFGLLAKVEKLTRFPLDIVELERVEPEYAELIKRYGKKVWENHETGTC